jgi:hypothetical protein
MKTSHNYQLSPIYLVLTDGYYSMNINELVFKKYKILITAVTTSKLDQESQTNDIDKKRKL